MYQYDAYDHRLVADRVAQFRDQVRRRISGELTEEEFLPLRLQNGLYMQRHAYMLRVAIPYGLLAAKQLRMLSHIAAEHDRGYGHFSTRQNIQYNWIQLDDVPNILGKLASVEMHAIQTSGNCIRNITTDQFAGVAPDEFVDPRPLAEILRQWSTFIPEFAFLPRKFKIAISATREDRAVTQLHDIGVYAYQGADGQTLLRIWPAAAWAAPRSWVRSSRKTCRGSTCCRTSRRPSACTTAMAAATTSTRRASRSW